MNPKRPTMLLKSFGDNDLVIPAVVSGPANVSPVGPVADEGSSRDELIPQQQSVRTVPVASEPVVNVQLDQNMVERGARQEKRIKELEEHILRKSKDELDLAKKALGLEQQVGEGNVQIQEYENKLAQVLPLLQTLDQSRQEAREAKRRAQITADELAALTGDHQLLAQELAKCRKDFAAAQEGEQAAAQSLAENQAAVAREVQQVAHTSEKVSSLQETVSDLEKQLQDEREESGWLQQVAARQAKEMEVSIESLKNALESKTSKYGELEEQHRELCNANDQLVVRMKQQVDKHAAQQEQVTQVINRMSAGNAGLAEEMEQLQTQLATVQTQQTTNH